MAKKRKSDATRLDEVDRSMYAAFCSAANSLSLLYSQAVSQQRLSFQAGERHAMEKLHSWMLLRQDNGIRVTPGDILAYLQNELDIGTEEPPLSLPFHQQSQNFMQSMNSGISVSSNAFGPTTIGQGLRSVNSDQSNSLCSPVRRSLQSYHLSQGGRSNESNGSQTREPNPPGSNDTSMDMHADSPGHDSSY